MLAIAIQKQIFEHNKSLPLVSDASVNAARDSILGWELI